MSDAPAPSVLTGIDVLARDEFALLSGTRVGLITNHTGQDRDGVATVDVLHGAPGVELRALFGPEHGIRGALDEAVPDSRDERTGLAVYSLYGARYQPAPEMLEGLDTLVFDIQDIGCRFYTYISTLGHCLEAAAKHGLRFVVLDRPNPINGMATEGPLADDSRLSFTAYHPLPVRHGLTVGELAMLFAGERGWNANLVVVKCEGWKRADWWDATGLTWVNPSPNMRSLAQATLYPGVGLLETTNVSVGRGTDTPFEILGAPYIDGRTLAYALNAKNLPGVRFIPVRFTPRASKFADESCGGVNLLVTDRNKFAPVRTGLEIALSLRTLYLEQWQASKFMNLLASRAAMDGLLAGEDYPALGQRAGAGICAPSPRPAPNSCCTSEPDREPLLSAIAAFEPKLTWPPAVRLSFTDLSNLSKTASLPFAPCTARGTSAPCFSSPRTDRQMAGHGYSRNGARRLRQPATSASQEAMMAAGGVPWARAAGIVSLPIIPLMLDRTSAFSSLG